jgi:hypothetical protein
VTKHAIAALLLLVAAIKLLPVAGLAGGDMLEKLYGIDVADPNLELLLRHRAALFGLLGALIAAGALYRPLRGLAFGGAWASVLSFLVLAAGTASRNEAIGRVVAADLVALAALVVATVLALAERRGRAVPS